MPRGHPSPGLPAELVLRTPTPWAAVFSFGLLGGTHLAFAAYAYWQNRWEGLYFGLGLGVLFVLVAAAVGRLRTEVRVVPVERRVFVRTGVGPVGFAHDVRFDDVRGVRLTLLPGGDAEAKIEILALDGDVECPSTPVPRQEALLLAMMMDVPLTKVSADDGPAAGHVTRDDERVARDRLP